MANSSKGLRNKVNAQALATADASSQNAASLELSDTVAHAIAELCWSYAEQLVLDDVYHSPLGAPRGAMWYGDDGAIDLWAQKLFENGNGKV